MVLYHSRKWQCASCKWLFTTCRGAHSCCVGACRLCADLAPVLPVLASAEVFEVAKLLNDLGCLNVEDAAWKLQTGSNIAQQLRVRLQPPWSTSLTLGQLWGLHGILLPALTGHLTRVDSGLSQLLSQAWSQGLVQATAKDLSAAVCDHFEHGQRQQPCADAMRAASIQILDTLASLLHELGSSSQPNERTAGLCVSLHELASIATAYANADVASMLSLATRSKLQEWWQSRHCLRLLTSVGIQQRFNSSDWRGLLALVNAITRLHVAEPPTALADTIEQVCISVLTSLMHCSQLMQCLHHADADYVQNRHAGKNL